ncbi:hypothetical protein P7K49_002161 [Saguinus oedipus]|uniref:Uncharacterized protein n=1 Tax=Saguinus oedipus TaxID=9490 RepID=A0ABQ9WH15_SAGOE|nr:hypothetical protein P7K49_002161 [Saguinus oedipus]
MPHRTSPDYEGHTRPHPENLLGLRSLLPPPPRRIRAAENAAGQSTKAAPAWNPGSCVRPPRPRSHPQAWRAASTAAPGPGQPGAALTLQHGPHPPAPAPLAGLALSVTRMRGRGPRGTTGGTERSASRILVGSHFRAQSRPPCTQRVPASQTYCACAERSRPASAVTRAAGRALVLLGVWSLPGTVALFATRCWSWAPLACCRLAAPALPAPSRGDADTLDPGRRSGAAAMLAWSPRAQRLGSAARSWAGVHPGCVVTRKEPKASSRRGPKEGPDAPPEGAKRRAGPTVHAP